jgi:hypothetical protein
MTFKFLWILFRGVIYGLNMIFFKHGYVFHRSLCAHICKFTLGIMCQTNIIQKHALHIQDNVERRGF